MFLELKLMSVVKGLELKLAFNWCLTTFFFFFHIEQVRDINSAQRADYILICYQIMMCIYTKFKVNRSNKWNMTWWKLLSVLNLDQCSCAVLKQHKMMFEGLSGPLLGKKIVDSLNVMSSCNILNIWTSFLVMWLFFLHLCHSTTFLQYLEFFVIWIQSVSS